VTSLLFHLVHLHFQKKEEPFEGFGKARLHFLAWSKLQTPTQEILALVVRNVISGLETNPIRALIGGACLVWQCAPSRAA
jgi:hypothetical protein